MMTDVIYTKHFRDLNFTVTALPRGHYVEYKIYDIIGYTTITDSDTQYPIWQRAGSDCFDLSYDLKDSETYISGSVKWDGCSNWNIDENERGMLHGCCRQDIQRIGDIMAQCWDWTAQLISDKWDGE